MKITCKSVQVEETNVLYICRQNLSMLKQNMVKLE